jgi:ABC-type glycerol-3-phosphate transport system permease component
MKKLTGQAALGYLVLALFVFISLLPLWMALKLALTNPADVYTSAVSSMSDGRPMTRRKLPIVMRPGSRLSALV